MGSFAREKLKSFSKNNSKIYIYDYLGEKGYYTAMKYCAYMLGNSSSGIIEAASLGCYVINVGNRQKGRLSNKNVFHSPCKKSNILKVVNKIRKLGKFKGANIYYKPDTLKTLLTLIKKII